MTEKMSPIDTIFDLIHKKNIDVIKNNELLIHFYEKSNIEEKKRINQIIICITGYSLETIIYEPYNIKD